MSEVWKIGKRDIANNRSIAVTRAIGEAKDAIEKRTLERVAAEWLAGSLAGYKEEAELCFDKDCASLTDLLVKVVRETKIAEATLIADMVREWGYDEKKMGEENTYSEMNKCAGAIEKGDYREPFRRA